MRKAAAYAISAAAVLTTLVAAARSAGVLQPGLAAQYSRDGTAAGRVSRVDRPPLTAALAAAPFPPDSPFSVTWTGQLWVPEGGAYTLAVNADAGTSLFVDGRAVFDNVRFPDVEFASGAVTLAAGGHALFISYAHRRGASPRADFAWAEGSGPLSSVPAGALQPRRAGAFTVGMADMIDRAPVWLAWLWAIVLGGAIAAAFAWVAALGRRALERAGTWRSMRWVLAGSAVLIACGVWWGLPAEWVPIELTQTFVLDGLAHHFSNGWYDAYPPLHYYVLSAVISPLLVLHSFAGVDIFGVAAHTAIVLLFRLVTVFAALGVVACVSLCATELYGRRAGVAGACVFALVTPFVFYGKTANVDVPYLFWFAVSMVFYVRLAAGLRLRDFVLFAAAGTCAICTKDQAYGLYLLAPVVSVWLIWRDNRGRSAQRPFLRALVDRRIIAAAVTAAALFAAIHNLAFNFSGFRGHVEFIVGPGSETYRMFEPTVGGHLTLLGLTVRLIQRSLGWPLFVLCAGGAVAALAGRRTRIMALCLLAPPVAYYLSFINVILYNYDRFVLPVCFVLAIFGGLAADRLLARAWPSRAAVAGVLALSYAYTVLYASTVDVLMLRDSRYEAERWMRPHVGSDLVAVTELPELLPGLAGFRTIAVATIDELARERPRFIVLNVDYAHAAAAGTAWADLVDGIEHERLGYRSVARFRSAAPWRWLPWAHPDLVGPRDETMVSSVLRDINPTIEVFERGD